MSHRELALTVSRHLPEFVREDYPTFVAFVEAYYEYMKTQGVDFDELRDIDTTLDDFVQYFKKQLANNLPVVIQDERILLQHIKDQYLAKGSQGSYKLLFRLLFGKNVELTFPGDSMLIPSDGRWNQEISIFVDVDYGDPDDVVGKLVEISSGDRVLSVLIDRKEELIGEVDRVRQISANVYEMYLDKRFFGEINPGDKIRYLDEFQASILPATTTLTVTQPGKNFRIGQVFELRQGQGTGALVKVTQVSPIGGIERAELIKFGIGYTANFALSILATNSVTTKQRESSSSAQRTTADVYESVASGAITFTSGSDQVTITSGGSIGTSGNAQVGNELRLDSDGSLIGVVKSIESNTSATLVEPATSSGTDEVYVFRNRDSVGTEYEYVNGAGDTVTGQWSDNILGDTVPGFEEQGYVNKGDVFAVEYVDATFAGTILREFALNSANANINAEDPAIIQIDLGALNKYPGYFETNSGFISDSIFIQDSKYYQKFSYVTRIDERLNTYKSAVKTMVHPSGMRLFGEFNITNNYNLGLALESLVRSLGIGLEDDQVVEQTDYFWTLTKAFADNVTMLDNAVPLEKELSLDISNLDSVSMTDNDDLSFSKSLETNTVGTLDDSDWIHLTTKELLDQQSLTDNNIVFSFDQQLSDTPIVTESLVFGDPADADAGVAKYVEDNTVGTWSNLANVWMNSYNGQDYWDYTEAYSGGLEQTTTN